MISFLKSHLNLIEVATVLTVYGIETYVCAIFKMYFCEVATVLTVYGIETKFQTQPLEKINCCNSTYRLRY